MPTNNNDATIARLKSNLGLCARARSLIFGTPMVCEAMRSNKPPCLVLEAGDSSDNTHKRLTDKCSFYHIQHIRLPITGGELGAAVGKTSTVAAIAITNEQLCKPVLTAWNMLIESSDPPSFRTKD
jgi:ribosomal protein L7Ae-like RNA K-turn-binding protein